MWKWIPLISSVVLKNFRGNWIWWNLCFSNKKIPVFSVRLSAIKHLYCDKCFIKFSEKSLILVLIGLACYSRLSFWCPWVLLQQCTILLKRILWQTFLSLHFKDFITSLLFSFLFSTSFPFILFLLSSLQNIWEMWYIWKMRIWFKEWH